MSPLPAPSPPPLFPFNPTPTAYVFLNELPSPSGVVGVMVVTLGGYLLNRVGSGAPPAVPKLDMLLPSLNGKPSASGVTAAVAAAADAVLLPTCGLRLQRNSSVTLGLLPPVDLEAQAPLGVGMSSSGGGGAVAGGTGVPVKRYAAAAGLKQRRSVSMSDLLKAPLMAIQLRQEPGTILMIGAGAGRRGGRQAGGWRLEGRGPRALLAAVWQHGVGSARVEERVPARTGRRAPAGTGALEVGREESLSSGQ